jgi:hypothetical protein
MPLLCLFFSIVSRATAQLQPSLQSAQPPQTHLQQNDNLLRFLDKSSINTGILYDRSFPLADVEDFNGQMDASTSHSEHFYQSYYELHSASYNANGRPTPAQLRNSVNEYATLAPISESGRPWCSDFIAK